jgi:hypothetical protein
MDSDEGWIRRSGFVQHMVSNMAPETTVDTRYLLLRATSDTILFVIGNRKESIGVNQYHEANRERHSGLTEPFRSDDCHTPLTNSNR